MNENYKVTSERAGRVQLLEIINAVLGLACVYPLAASFSAGSRGEVWRFTAYAILLLIPTALSFIMVRRVRSLALYALIAAVTSVLLALGAYSYGGVIPYGQFICPPMTLLFCVIIYVVRIRAAIEQRQMQNDFAATHDGEENVFMEKWEVASFLTRVKPSNWILCMICYAAALVTSRSHALFPLFWILFMQIIVFFLHEYLENFEQYIRDNARVANMPIRMMKKVHTTIFGIALALLIAFMLPSVLYGKEPLDGFMERLPKREINAEDMIIDEMPAEDMGGGMDMDMSELMGEDTWEWPEWFKKLMDLLLYAIAAAFSVSVLWALIGKLRDMSKEYSTDEMDEVLYLDDIAAEERQALYRGKKQERGIFSPNAQIRRRYKKLIKKGTKGTPEQWAAPSELEAAASMEADSLLHQIYEKARYSQNGCDRTDLELLSKK